MENRNPERRFRLALPTLVGLMLLALACTCPCSLSNLAGIQATASMAQGTLEAVQGTLSVAQGTLEAAATEAGAYLPTAQAEMTRIVGAVTQNAPAYEASLTSVVATADALAGRVQPTASTGTVMGRMCYPSSGIPPMVIFAQEITTGAILQLPHADSTQYVFANIPAGDYVFFAYTRIAEPGGSELGGAYTAFVTCGQTADCQDHTLLTVHVEAGQTVGGVDICDWYLPPGNDIIPPDPG